MIIDQLPAISLPVQDTDELPIERGQYTYKATVANLIGGIKSDVTSLQTGKQDTLVSGTNIKTINNNSLLGSGDIPIGGAVDSVNGKTGTVVLDADDVGAMSEWKLLWTNASPTSSFAAQTILLDLSGYDMILIKLKYDNTVLYGYADCIGYQFAAKGETTDISLINGIVPDGLSGQNPYIHSRAATVGSTGIVFSAGYRKKISDTAVATAENTAAIPLAIYGIKGVS